MDDSLSMLHDYEAHLWQLMMTNSDPKMREKLIFSIGSVDNYIISQIKQEEDNALTEKYKEFHQHDKDKRV